MVLEVSNIKFMAAFPFVPFLIHSGGQTSLSFGVPSVYPLFQGMGQRLGLTLKELQVEGQLL